MWPPADRLLAAWRELVADSDTAGQFAEIVLAPLQRSLAAKFPRADPHDITSAIQTAVLFVIKNPARYDPARSPLPAFLRLVARRRLANLSAKEGRHHRGRIPWDDVEVRAAARNTRGAEPRPFDSPAWQAVLAGLGEAEARVFGLMRAGERRTSAYAAALDITGRGAAEQRAEVKRVKDRILARLKRAARAGGVGDA